MTERAFEFKDRVMPSGLMKSRRFDVPRGTIGTVMNRVNHPRSGEYYIVVFDGFPYQKTWHNQYRHEELVPAHANGEIARK